ncbi:MAG TPA: FAD/NAD(P)-binding protein [Acidimicrobiales bacterium]|nr:FAD/NAD(P)-binding protein [Acidimicrobiales bacterium]
MIEFAVVGFGSWGLCVLERAVAQARRSSSTVRVHVIEPGALGGGVYAMGQPDYLVLNNPCGQLSLYASPDGEEEPPYAVGLFDWATRQGYRWVGHECRIGTAGQPIAATDYLPRRLMGEYLVWFYDTLVADAPSNIEVVRHYATAVDIAPVGDGREAVVLDNGETLRVNHVVLTSGHTWNEEADDDEADVRGLRPYPVEYFDSTVAPGSPIAIAGLGLVGFDLLTALTVGRGGRFEDVGDRMRYRPSGNEPIIHMYSRSGIPYCAKSAHGVDPYGGYQPVVCTPEEIAALTHPGGSPERHQVDFRRDLLPLLYAEMQARYLIHAAFLKGGADESADVRQRLTGAWANGGFEAAVEGYDAVYGRFDPAGHLFAGTGRTYTSGTDFQSQFYDLVESDLEEALTIGGSPVKAALEVLRILRDQLRLVIEFGGLTLESYVDFQSNIRGRINRMEAGPPPLRSQQLLALLDAGVVQARLGPNPTLTSEPDGRTTLRSTGLAEETTITVNGVIRGHLDLPSLARSSSPLLRRLYANGRLTQMAYGDTPVGSVSISEDFHPYDCFGALQPNLSLLGVLTEGARYFTHYLPSPRSRIRAVLDAQQCVREVIG